MTFRSLVLLLLVGCGSPSQDVTPYLSRLESFWERAEPFLTPEFFESAGLARATLDRALENRDAAHRAIAEAMIAAGQAPERLDDPRSLMADATTPALRVVLGIRTEPVVAEASVEGPMEAYLDGLGRAMVRGILVVVAHEIDAEMPADASFARAAIRMLADETFLDAMPRDVVADESVAPDRLHLVATGRESPREGDAPEYFAAFALAHAGMEDGAPSEMARAADPDNGLWDVLAGGTTGRPVRTYLREIWAARERSLRGPMAGFVAAYQVTLPHALELQLTVALEIDRIRGGDAANAAAVETTLRLMREAAVLPHEWAAIREMEGDLFDAVGRPREAAAAWVDAGAFYTSAPDDVITAALKAAVFADDPAAALAELRTDEWRDAVIRRSRERLGLERGEASFDALRALYFENRRAPGVLRRLAALDW